MSIQEFEELQAEMPTPELIKKARYWIKCMDESPNIGKDVVRLLGEMCRRLEIVSKFDVAFTLVNAAQTLLDNLEETHAALCFTPDYIGSLRYEQNKAAIEAAKGIKQNAPGQTFVQPGDAKQE